MGLGIQVHGLKEKITYLDNILASMKKAAPSAEDSPVKQSAIKSGRDEKKSKASGTDSKVV